jgi:intein/homing endonuclease
MSHRGRRCVSHKARIVELWLQGYEYTDLERKTGHSGASIRRYLAGFSKVVKFLERGYSETEIRELTELSERVLREYRDLYLTYKERPETQTRYQQVLASESGGGKTSVQQGLGEGGNRVGAKRYIKYERCSYTLA